MGDSQQAPLCPHDFLARMIPQPPAGTECPECHEPFTPRRTFRINGDCVTLSDQEYEDLRAYFRLWAIFYAHLNGEDGVTSGYRTVQMERIVEDRGWTEWYGDCRDGRRGAKAG